MRFTRTSIPCNQPVPSSYTSRRQNKWHGGRRLLTTSNKVGRNVILIRCLTARWETREGFLQSGCVKRTQYDMGSFFFFFLANGSFLRARLLRRANVLCGKRPSGSVYGRGDVPNREARAAKCRGKAQLFNTPMSN